MKLWKSGGKILTRDGKLRQSDDPCCCEAPGCGDCDLNASSTFEIEIPGYGTFITDEFLGDEEFTCFYIFEDHDAADECNKVCIVGVFKNFGPWTVQCGIRRELPSDCDSAAVYQGTFEPTGCDFDRPVPIAWNGLGGDPDACISPGPSSANITRLT